MSKWKGDVEDDGRARFQRRTSNEVRHAFNNAEWIRFPEEQCYFGTAFLDRADTAFKKALPQLAWGTFAWFSTEPKGLMVLFDRPINLSILSK